MINPYGATGTNVSIWKKIEEAMQAKGIPYHSLFSTLEYGMEEIAKELSSDGVEKDVILIGGDGSLNEFVNGLQNFDHIRLGLIPCGSGNDFAKSLGMKKNPIEALEEILKGEVHHTLDVGEVDIYDENENISATKRFNNACGIGFDAEICYEADAANNLKKGLNVARMGKLIYVSVAVKILSHLKQTMSTITIDHKMISKEKLIFAAVMNEPYEGGGFMFGGKHAKGDDGIFDVCIADGFTAKDFWRIFPKAYSGNHVHFDGMDVLRGKDIVIQCEDPLWVHVDGEVVQQSKHIVVRLAKEKLQVLN